MSPLPLAWWRYFGGRRYLALGDSMSIDAYAGGTGRGAASLLHHNWDSGFPGWPDETCKPSATPSRTWPATARPPSRSCTASPAELQDKT